MPVPLLQITFAFLENPPSSLAAAPLNSCPRSRKSSPRASRPLSPSSCMRYQMRTRRVRRPPGYNTKTHGGTGSSSGPAMHVRICKQAKESPLSGERPKDLRAHPHPHPRRCRAAGSTHADTQERCLCAGPATARGPVRAWALRLVRAVPAGGGSRAQKTKGRKRLAFLTLCWQ